MESSKVYFCIDMKSFYASVECAERGLDPFKTDLVVADESRGQGAITLAISPSLKAKGVPKLSRLYEIPKKYNYIIAPPRMKKYIQYCGDIFDVYLNYISPDDIHQYSIDEAFLDVTNYLTLYKVDKFEFAKTLIKEIRDKVRVPATAGIGTNMYLAKIALDITAKKSSDGIGYLDEKLFIEKLWKHKPLIDFWNIGKGITARLYKLGILDMEGIATCREDILFKQFGKNARILIDHAYGKETCTIADIKKYVSKSRSVSNSQILFSDYETDKAYIVLKEMTLNICQRLQNEGLVAHKVGMAIGYSKDILPMTGATETMIEYTNCFSVIIKYIEKIFSLTTVQGVPVRRIIVSASDVISENFENYDLFTNLNKICKEKKVNNAIVSIKGKFGKNSVLRGFDLMEGATQIERNKMIGGHKAGE